MFSQRAVLVSNKAQIRIAPSLLAADFTRLGEQVHEAELAGAELIHIDVMDGRFVPNITLGPVVVEAVRRVTKLPLDVHLMIVEPERHIEAFVNAGANSINIHLEASPNLHRTLQMMRELGCRSGVALNPHTPASALSEIMNMVDVILVMTVNPGFGGQSLLEETMPKIAQLRAMIGDTKRPIDLEADGGIDPDTVMTVAQAGANVMIAGTAIFNDTLNVQKGMAALRHALEKLS
jgi:ribulose-phosphate 3-epimerase